MHAICIHFLETEGEQGVRASFPPLVWGSTLSVHQVKQDSISGSDYLLSALLSAQEHYQSLNQQSMQQHDPIRGSFSSTTIESGLSNIRTIQSIDIKDQYISEEVFINMPWL